MSVIEEIIQEVEAAGMGIRPDPPDLVIKPANRLTPELETRRSEHKTEFLQHLKLEAEASMQRLETAGIWIAVWD
jgi:hypothetical protein